MNYYKDIPNIKQDYKQGDQVFIFNLDDSGREYRATICGITFSNIINHYIVAPLNPQELNMREFTHTSIPASCLKPCFNENDEDPYKRIFGLS